MRSSNERERPYEQFFVEILGNLNRRGRQRWRLVKSDFFLPSNFTITKICSLYRSVYKPAQTKPIMRAINSRRKYERLAIAATFSKTRRTWSFHVVVSQRTVTNCTKIYNTHAQPLFCSSNLLSTLRQRGEKACSFPNRVCDWLS